MKQRRLIYYNAYEDFNDSATVQEQCANFVAQIISPRCFVDGKNLTLSDFTIEKVSLPFCQEDGWSCGLWSIWCMHCLALQVPLGCITLPNDIREFKYAVAWNLIQNKHLRKPIAITQDAMDSLWCDPIEFYNNLIKIRGEESKANETLNSKKRPVEGVEDDVKVKKVRSEEVTPLRRTTRARRTTNQQNSWIDRALKGIGTEKFGCVAKKIMEIGVGLKQRMDGTIALWTTFQSDELLESVLRDWHLLWTPEEDEEKTTEGIHNVLSKNKISQATKVCMIVCIIVNIID